jgi:DSF synthase
MDLKDHPHCRTFHEAGSLSNMTVWYEAERNIVWAMLRAQPRPCFSPDVLRDIESLSHAVRKAEVPIDFLVTGSVVPGIFNVGGDLSYFVANIRSGDRHALMQYARSCIDASWELLTGFGVGIISLAMIEGSALGGGFEGALAHDFILAQSDARLGFPEVAFNLYPGMGAHSLVSRKVSRHLAERLIMSGEAHTAEWHADKGLVDLLFEPDGAYLATRTFIDGMRPKLNGIRGMLRARRRVQAVGRDELMDIAEDWARSAFLLKEKDLAYMERLVMLQNRRARALGSD